MISAEYNPLSILQADFPDGTPRISCNVCRSLNKIRLVWKYHDESELFRLICITRHLRTNNPGIHIELFMPYIPNARMDRVRKPNTDVFTLKYFCEIINSLNFDKVYVLDAHSNVSLGLLDRVVNLMPTRLIDDIVRVDYAEKNLLVYYPDEGAIKRYSDKLKYPYTFGIKKRNFDTGKITNVVIACDIDKVKDKDVLIVDDICSYGGTFMLSAQALKDAGARSVRLFVTHCEDSIYKGSLLTQDLIERVYTTDSIYGLDQHVYSDPDMGGMLTGTVDVRDMCIPYIVGSDLDDYGQENPYKLYE